MNRFLNPLLFLLANTPHAERNLHALMTMMQATTDSVKNIRSGIDNFQATIIKMAEMGQSGQSPVQNKPEPPAQPEPGPKAQPPPEPVIAEPAAPEPDPLVTPDPVFTPDPTPVIQMPPPRPPGTNVNT